MEHYFEDMRFAFDHLLINRAVELLQECGGEPHNLVNLDAKEVRQVIAQREYYAQISLETEYPDTSRQRIQYVVAKAKDVLFTIWAFQREKELGR